MLCVSWSGGWMLIEPWPSLKLQLDSNILHGLVAFLFQVLKWIFLVPSFYSGYFCVTFFACFSIWLLEPDDCLCSLSQREPLSFISLYFLPSPYLSFHTSLSLFSPPSCLSLPIHHPLLFPVSPPLHWLLS